MRNLLPVAVLHAAYHKGEAIILESAADAAILESPDDFAVSFCRGEGRDAVLKNCIIRNSLTAVFITHSSPIIANLILDDNDYGTGAHANSNPDISNSIFWNDIAGDPAADYSKEPTPNGGRINLGAHGGTPYASMNQWPFEWDLNYDHRVDINDLLILIDQWLQHVDWAGYKQDR